MFTRIGRQQCAHLLWRAALLLALLTACGSRGSAEQAPPEAALAGREQAAENSDTLPAAPAADAFGAGNKAPGSPEATVVFSTGGGCAATAASGAQPAPGSCRSLGTEAAAEQAAGTNLTAADDNSTANATEAQQHQQKPADAAGSAAVAVDTTASAAATEQQASGAAEQPAAAAAAEAAAASAAASAAQQQAAAAATPSPAPAPAAEEPSAVEEQHHNFALEKDGAKVLAVNKEAKKAPALLDDDSDTFLKNDCRADKWVVVELSQVAKISRIELSQNELYSARVREFEVYGRQSHPRTDGVGSEYVRGLNSSAWKLVGNFTAEKAKGTQSFTVEQPRWARFLLLRFLSQHGPEPVCAINGVAVFGRSAVEELEDQLASEEGLGYLQAELEPPAAEPVPPAAAVPGAGGGLPVPPAPEPVLREGSAPAAGAAVAQATSAGADGAPGSLPPNQQQQQPAAQQQPAPQQQPQQHGSGSAVDSAGKDQPPPAAAPDNGSGEAAAGNASEAAHSGTVTATPEPARAPGAAAAQQQQPASPANGAGSASSGSGSAAAAEPPANSAGATGSGPTSTSHAPTAGQASTTSVAAAAAAAAGTASASQAGSSGSGGNQAPVAGEGSGQSVPAADATSEPPSSSSGQPLAPASSGSSAGPIGAVPAAGGVGGGDAAAQQQVAQQSAASAGAAGAGTGAAAPPTPAAQPAGAGAASAATPAAATTPAASPAAGAGPVPGLELPLAALSAKGKGGGVYDILVQEIKSAKLQQKLLSRGLAELQRNSSFQYAELAGDIASLATTLSKLQSQLGHSNLSEEQLALRVDLLVKAHLLHVTNQMMGLQAALASAAKQQHALLCFLAMMGAVLALNAAKFGDQWPRVKWVVALLAAVNGLVGVALQVKGGMAPHPYFMPALPPWDT